MEFSCMNKENVMLSTEIIQMKLFLLKYMLHSWYQYNMYYWNDRYSVVKFLIKTCLVLTRLNFNSYIVSFVYFSKALE